MSNERITLIFRDLRADEIDCRISTVSEKGLSLLLYKDARCDMNILDETVGSYNWQRSHTRDNANCIVSIWDDVKNQWISKEDVGTESFTEAAKGLASDSFKRACFNWGIGRELYTAPFIWVGSDKCEIKKRNDGKYVSYDKFFVRDLIVKDKKIIGLSIYNASKKAIVYTYGNPDAYKARQRLKDYIRDNELDGDKIIAKCGLNAQSSKEDYEAALEYCRGLVG